MPLTFMKEYKYDQLLGYARECYDWLADQPYSAGAQGRRLVAAFQVPGKRVYFSTVPAGPQKDEITRDKAGKAPKWAAVTQEFMTSGGATPDAYHAEDGCNYNFSTEKRNDECWPEDTLLAVYGIFKTAIRRRSGSRVLEGILMPAIGHRLVRKSVKDLALLSSTRTGKSTDVIMNGVDEVT